MDTARMRTRLIALPWTEKSAVLTHSKCGFRQAKIAVQGKLQQWDFSGTGVQGNNRKTAGLSRVKRSQLTTSIEGGELVFPRKIEKSGDWPKYSKYE